MTAFCDFCSKQKVLKAALANGALKWLTQSTPADLQQFCISASDLHNNNAWQIEPVPITVNMFGLLLVKFSSHLLGLVFLLVHIVDIWANKMVILCILMQSQAT